MLKTTRDLTSSSLTIGVVLAGLALVAPDANALTVVSKSLEDFQNNLITIDGIISLKWQAQTGLNKDDTVKFFLDDSVFSFQYIPLKGLTTLGSLKYEIKLLDPNYYFSGVQLDSDTTNYQVKKFVNTNLVSLTSGNGIPDPQPDPDGEVIFAAIPGQLTELTIEDIFTPGTSGTKLLRSASNQFQIAPVPEPGTILGLLAVGGIGFLSRFRKQK